MNTVVEITKPPADLPTCGGGSLILNERLAIASTPPPSSHGALLNPLL